MTWAQRLKRVFNIDQDCDGIDPQDADGDGFISSDTGGDDCDDTNPDIHPGAEEVCDSVDNNCDGQVGDDDPAVAAPQWCMDTDNDGFGDPATLVQACGQPDGLIADCSDCNDNDGQIGGGCVFKDGFESDSL